jgi:predicted transcriptional regulator of viral defense system
MKHTGRPYYVGLLSAAQLHGAAHQRPQEFQVVIPRRTVRPVRAGNVVLRFYGKGSFEQWPWQEIKTPAGSLKASTPETTACDLVRYQRSAGGLDHVATVLAELSEKLDARELRATVRRHGDSLVAQRLGYLLDRLRRQDLTKDLAAWVAKAPLRPLAPGASIDGARESHKWRLLVNASVEVEA